MNLSTKTSRSKLKPRSAAYVHTLGQGRALLYRRRSDTKAGTWTLRLMSDDGRYRFEALGTADDMAEADGVAVLDFKTALALAAGKENANPASITVADAAAAWASDKILAGVSPAQATNLRGEARRLAEAFPRRNLKTITVADIKNWQADFIARGRTRSTADRRLAILKAALNQAADEAGYTSPRAWSMVKPFGGSHNPRVRILSDDEERRLLAAATGGTRVLLEALLMTGARMGEIRTATVGDLHDNRLTVRGKTGTRTIDLSPRVAAFFHTQAGSREQDAPLIARDDGTAWPEGRHQKSIKTAVAVAGLDGVTSYTCRHTFISRHIARGVPVLAVAKHCGTSAAMIERTYAHFIPTQNAEWFA